MVSIFNVSRDLKVSTMKTALKNNILLILLFVFSLAQAQEETPEEREDFGNQMFEIGEFNLSKEIFEKLISEGNPKPNYYYRLGLSIMELSDPEEALPYLIKSKEMGFNESISNGLELDKYNQNYYSFNLNFALARGFHLSGDFKTAIEYYQKYLNEIVDLAYKDKEITTLYLKQAGVGMELKKSAEEVKIDNMGPRINSVYNDYGAQVYQDTSSLIFTRQQPNKNPKSVKIDDTYKEDIYISYKRKDGKWIEPFRIGQNINDDSKDDFASALFDNDKKLIVHYENGKLYEFERVGTSWANTKKLNKDIFARGLTIAGNYMIISSSFYNSLGGYDLFFASKDKEGKWSEFKPLPSTINSEHDENYPFLDPIDLALYYSTNGNKSSGGYDVFKADFNPLTNTWDKAENIGYPINTPRDDIYFTHHSTSKVAFYNSQRKDTYGGLDIYMVDYTNLKSHVVKVIIKIQTKDSSQAPIVSDFTILEDETSNIPLIIKSDSSGMAYLDLLSNRSYHLNFKNEDYELLDTLISLNAEDKERLILVRLETLEEGKKYTLTNVQFDRDESKLKIAAYNELDKFFVFLKDHQDLAIEISGHTELGGIESQNKELSQLRADAVKEYLVKKGIDSKRLMSIGYGSKYPITKENTEEAKSLNRRTEIILHHINSKDSDWKPYYSK